jgi:hypothetical protein
MRNRRIYLLTPLLISFVLLSVGSTFAGQVGYGPSWGTTSWGHGWNGHRYPFYGGPIITNGVNTGPGDPYEGGPNVYSGHTCTWMRQYTSPNGSQWRMIPVC